MIFIQNKKVAIAAGIGNEITKITSKDGLRDFLLYLYMASKLHKILTGGKISMGINKKASKKVNPINATDKQNNQKTELISFDFFSVIVT